jgi:hypothetical protein
MLNKNDAGGNIAMFAVLGWLTVRPPELTRRVEDILLSRLS